MASADFTLPPTTIAQTKECLRNVWTGESGQSIVPMLWGEPGIGKSSLVTQVAKHELQYERVVKLIASKLRPEDLSGVPFPYEPGYSKFHPPLWLFLLTKRGQEWAADQHRRRVTKGETTGDFHPLGNTVLFLDELTLAPQDIQAPLLSLIEDRTLGAEELELEDNVRLVAAGNRATHGAFARPLSAPMKTRLAPHLEVVPTFDEWITYARQMGVYPPILAYLQQHPKMLGESVEAGEGTTQARATYAKPRTWFKASTLCQTIRDPEILEIALHGTVGPAAAQEFMTYLRTARRAPTVEEIAADPLGAPVYNEDPDISYLITENIYAALRRDPTRYTGPLLQYAKRMHLGYRAIIVDQIVGIDGPQTQDFLDAVLFENDGFGMVTDTCRQTTDVEHDGDLVSTAVKRPSASGARIVR